MELRFVPRGIVEMDDAHLCFKNFKGEPEQYNAAGDRNFAIVIPTEEMAQALTDDHNKYGIGWNVKVKAPREEGDNPFTFLKVKVKFNDRGPIVYLHSGNNRVRLTEDTIGTLDDIRIARVDLNIRPYDDEINGRPFRAAYLESMRVYQELNRFDAEWDQNHIDYEGE